MNVIADLYQSEINGMISWFYDDGFAVSLGDNLNGVFAEAEFDAYAEAERFLIEKAIEHYPDSYFAQKYGGTLD